MNLEPRISRRFLSLRVVILTVACGLVACAVLTSLVLTRAQQTTGPRAVVRHGLSISGRIEGSLQQLNNENTTINGSGVITDNLFVPGVPAVRLNGNPTFGGTLPGSGSAQPTNYQITLNGNARLGHLVTRTDPIAMPTVALPPAATGTRDVTLNNSSQSPGDFSTLRDLTLNGNVGMVSVPPGTYRRFTANGSNGFVLGVANSSQPTVYNLNSLTLNGGSQLQVIGPVVLTAANAVTLNSVIGSAAIPLWLNLRIASGGLTLNGGGTLHGVVTAPSGTVTVNGNSSLIGNVVCDRLAINGNGLLRILGGDTAAPNISIQQPAEGAFTNATQMTVTGTFSDESATTITVNGIAAALQGTTFTANVPVVEGANLLTVIATDSAGNHSEATRNIIRDTIAPTLTVSQPANGLVTADAQIVFSGNFSDANPVVVSVDGTAAAISGNTYTATVPRQAGQLFLAVQAVDAAGNRTTIEREITGVADLSLNVVTPTQDQLLDINEVNVEGSATGTGVHVTANGQMLHLMITEFGGSLNLPEGTTPVTIEATDILGRTQTVVHNVTVDTTAPTITDVAPADGAVVPGTSTTITGRVNDATAVAVKVNDINASVGAGGVFTLVNFAVSEGPNAVKVKATDALGHDTFVDLVLQGKDRTAPPAPFIFPVPAETALAVQQAEGRAEPGSVVHISGGTQPLTVEAAEGTGLFFANVNLAVGNNALTITNTDKDGNVSAAAVLNVIRNPDLTRPAGQPFLINISTNDAQRGLVGQELPRPLIVRVTDFGGEAVANVPITFTVAYGGGHFVGGAQQVVANTDSDGRASARYIGVQSGFQYIRADFPDNPTRPVGFAAELLNPNPNGVTTAAGLVLDQNLRALPNVLVRLGGQQTRTAADGRFRLTNVSFGPHQVLELVGRDQIPFPGRWPNISYDFDVLPGVENHLGRPLFLPRVNPGVQMPLNSENVITSDTVYELPAVGGQPPIRVTARAGTRVLFPPDVTDRRLSVTRIPVNRTPMVLEDGRSTELYISVQPSGAVFETPLELSFPNLDNLPPNSEVLLMSFDHDAGRYVQMGTGHVSADGSVVRSDAGSGIRIGAWHALPQRTPPRGPSGPRPMQATVLSHVQIEGNPAFTNRSVTVKEATVRGVRAVPFSDVRNSEGVLTRVLLRALIPMTSDDRPVTEIESVNVQANRPVISATPEVVNIAKEKTKDVDVTLTTPPNGDPTFSISSTNQDVATVAFADGFNANSSPTRIRITGGREAGAARIRIDFRDSNNGRAQRIEVRVNVIEVKFEQTANCNGFDKTVVGDEPFWLTVVMNGDQNNPQPGGTSTARARITPNNQDAIQAVTFETVDATKATVAPATAAANPQVITATSVAHGQTMVRALVDQEEVGKLGIAVRIRLKVTVAFHFMEDSANHRTNRVSWNAADRQTRAEALTDQLVLGMNAILTPQSGLEYVRGAIHFDTVSQDLTSIVSESVDLPVILGLNLRDSGAAQQFYFFWDWEDTETKPAPGQTFTIAMNRGQDTFAGDDADAHDLAHEAIHSFGVMPRVPFASNNPRHSANTGELMYPTRNGQGCLIPKRDLDAVLG